MIFNELRGTYHLDVGFSVANYPLVAIAYLQQDVDVVLVYFTFDNVNPKNAPIALFRNNLWVPPVPLTCSLTWI